MESQENRRQIAASLLRGYANFLRRQQDEHGQFLKKFDVIYGKSAKVFYPITIDIAPHEQTSVLDIIESDNRILNKILAAFSVLCNEVRDLQTEAAKKHFVFTAFYGEFFQKANITPSESIAKHIKDLHILNTFIKRCYEVTGNFCDQLVALYSSNLINLKGIKLHFILSHLGDLLVILVTLDNLVNNSPLQSHWAEYRKSVKLLKSQKSSESLRSLETVLNNIEDNVLSDKIFHNSYHSLSRIKNSASVQCIHAGDDFIGYVKRCVSDLERTTIDIYESLYSIQWIKVNALFAFHFNVFGGADKKIFKSLLEVNLKAHTVPLYGLAVWHPEQFLLQHVSVLCSTSSKFSQNIMKTRHAYIATKKQTLLKDVHMAHMQSCKWTLEVLQVFGGQESQLNSVEINHRMELLMQGVKFLSQINFFMTCFMSISVSQGVPMTKSTLMAICKFVETLKGMQRVFKFKFVSIVSSINLITQHLIFQIISALANAKKNLMADKNYASRRLDELSAIVIAERSLNGPTTLLRRIVSNVALSVVPSSAFQDDAHFKITSLMEKLENISDIHSKLEQFCDCTFIYWHRSVIHIYMQNVFASKKDMNRMRCFFDALNDCAKSIRLYSEKDDFSKEIESCFNDFIIKPLGQQIETNLRLHVHSHLRLDSTNPFQVDVEDNNALLALQNIKFDKQYLSINNAIEHYLSYTFYNLTTVVLHDWRTYGEMRQLARFRFNLDTVEDNLPTQTLEQGLDVLEIMRNIHVFVSNYLYNLNNQVFIERNSNNKYLNTINIRHIANSIRTHGLGIMSTTVNFTYQFLRKKFQTFSQFMYDEQIKSRLIKDMRHFREASLQSEQMYSYKRAEKFNKGIRNLGLNESGESYLDLFRVLIGHIGNAMGYVRMVRSGGLHCCANSTMFLPSLDEEDYEFLTVEDDMDALLKESMENLRHNIGNLTSNFTHGTHYFKLLVDVFAPAFRKSDNKHLKSFFMIVPPLTLNFVEHMLLAKDKISKKEKIGAAFTDDGFAMGLAYILKLLDQEEGMDSLNWFQSVNKHIADERKSIQDQLTNQTGNLQHALALTEKKLNLLEQEFQLLYFSFSSARIFFQ